MLWGKVTPTYVSCSVLALYAFEAMGKHANLQRSPDGSRSHSAAGLSPQAINTLVCLGYGDGMTGVERGVRFSVVLIVISLFIGFALFTFPAQKKSTGRLLDFSEFYAAGQIVRQGLGYRLYDLRLQAESQLQVAALHAFYVRPPFEALIFVPFTYLSYRVAYSVWIILSLALLAGACWLIERNTRVVDALSQYARGSQIDFGLLLVMFLGFPPTAEGLLIGQDSVLMLVVYTLVFIALKQKREFRAGCLLACGLFKFHLVLPFAIIFLLRRRWSFLGGFAGIGVLLIAVSILVSGRGVLLAYPRMFFNSNYRALMGFQPEYAANIRGLVFVIGTGKLPVLPGVLVGVLSGLLLWAIARNWRDEQSGLCFAAALAGTLLTGYHLFIYDLCLLLLAAAIVCGELAQRKALLNDNVLTATLLVLFIPPLHNFLIVHHKYAIMGLPILVLLGIIIRLVGRADTPQPLRSLLSSPDGDLTRESVWG